MSRDVHSCTHWLRPRNPRIWTRFTRALLASKDRRHLFMTPCPSPTHAVRGGGGLSNRSICASLRWNAAEHISKVTFKIHRFLDCLLSCVLGLQHKILLILGVKFFTLNIFEPNCSVQNTFCFIFAYLKWISFSHETVQFKSIILVVVILSHPKIKA